MDQIVKYGVPIVSVVLSILLATYTYFIHSKLREIIGDSEDMKKALVANVDLVRDVIDNKLQAIYKYAQNTNSKVTSQLDAVENIDSTIGYIIRNQEILRKASREMSDIMATDSKHVDSRVPDEFQYREPTPPRSTRTRRTRSVVRQQNSDSDDDEDALILSRRKKKQV